MRDQDYIKGRPIGAEPCESASSPAAQGDLRAAEAKYTEGRQTPPQFFGISWQRQTEELTLDNIDEAMNYQPWNAEQVLVGTIVREALTNAAKTILRHVPGSPRRTLALQHLINARLDVNTAITFRGRF